MDEEALRSRLQEHGWHRSRDGGDMRRETAQGTSVVEPKHSLRSTRDLHAALLQLAMVLELDAEIGRAYLITSLPRMTPRRVAHEWERVLKVLRPRLAKRMAFVAVGDAPVVLPNDAETRDLASLVGDLATGANQRQPNNDRRVTGKFFEVWKVLFLAWLNREGSVQVGSLAERAGCSYPTVAKILSVLEDRRELERDRSRSVHLTGLPRQTLREVFVLQESLRKPISFLDSSGRRPDVEFLLGRVEKLKPQGLALGGVVAARHYDPHFNLNGLPRLDVTLHGPIGLDWVNKVDPALTPMFTNVGQPVLVVHPLTRPKPNFVETTRHELPIADPVETLLDLYEMGFNQQADDLVKTLRKMGTTP